ncbi:MAG: hypothetical protein ACKO3S_06590 [bacterium]
MLGPIVGRILEAHSAQVVVVGTAEDALSALRAERFDALASARPYRAAYPHAAALDIIREESGRGLLDPELLSVFERAVRRVDDRAST